MCLNVLRVDLDNWFSVWVSDKYIDNQTTEKTKAIIKSRLKMFCKKNLSGILQNKYLIHLLRIYNNNNANTE